jgi:hypothetical protein
MSNLKSRIDGDVTLARLDYLVQAGFTKKQIADLTGIQAQTMRRLLKKRPEKVSMDTHLKVKAFHSDYIINRTNAENAVPEDDEPVIDFADSEEGAKEVAKWMWLSLGITAMALIGLIFVIRYVLSLF